MLEKAHELASQIYNQLKFSGTVSNCFDVLKMLLMINY